MDERLPRRLGTHTGALEPGDGNQTWSTGKGHRLMIGQWPFSVLPHFPVFLLQNQYKMSSKKCPFSTRCLSHL